MWSSDVKDGLTIARTFDSVCNITVAILITIHKCILVLRSDLEKAVSYPLPNVNYIHRLLYGHRPNNINDMICQ